MPHLDLKLDARWEALALPKAFDRCSILQSPIFSVARPPSYIAGSAYSLHTPPVLRPLSYFINSHAASLPTLPKWDQSLQPTACCTARAFQSFLSLAYLHHQLLNIPEAQLNAAAQGWDGGMRTCHAGARLISSSIPIHIYPFLHFTAAAVKRG